MAMSRSILITVAGGIALGIPTVSNACSKVGFYPVRSDSRAHFIAASTSDTVFAGAGSVRYVVAPGHSGPAGARAVFGQIVSVERIGGLASRALRQPVRRVLLVPWDYGADCTPTPWTRSAAWVEPGTRGLFTGVLRDSVHWAGGVPTFDIFTPEMEPYPKQVRRQSRGRRLPTDSIVPIDELFQLIELFPEERLLPDSAEAATKELFAWARANPTLTRRYPIAVALTWARGMVGTQRLRAIESPLTGTYELTVSLSAGPTRTFYARTRRVPTSEWSSKPLLPRPVDDPTVVPRPEGYYLMAALAESLGALPENCERGRDANREAYIAVVVPPADSPPDARRWTGVLEAKLVERAFPADAALREFAKADFNASYQRALAGLPAETPALFVRSADGTIYVEQKLTLEDGRSLTINGIRVSADTVACQW